MVAFFWCTVKEVMKKLWIEPGCITCGACEFIAPEVFEVTDISRIKPESDLQQTELIEQAVRSCPVQVIKYITPHTT